MASPASSEADLDDGRMPFIEHLRELRSRLRNASIAFVLAFVVCWIFSDRIYDWLRVPFDNAWLQHPNLGPIPKMSFLNATDPFWVSMSVAMWAGIFVASPIIFHQFWQFIAPGLYKRERRIGVLFAVCSALCFIAGALFCYYFVLEQLYAYLLGYADERLEANISINGYLDLTRDMMLAFGAVFEMPMMILFLSSVGMVTHRSLWKFNRWFVVLAFIVGAILTPSPDPVSQVLMALPMIALYNISIVISWVVTRRRERREAALGTSEGAPPPEEP